MSLSRNFLILISVIALCVIGGSYLYYQDRQSGIETEINKNGLTSYGN